MTIVFALALLPLVFAGLFAIDYARVTAARESLQDGLDAAVLAGVSGDGTDAPGLAQRFFRANTPTDALTGVAATFTVNSDGSLAGSASAKVALLAGGFFTTKQLDLAVTASAFRPVKKYESFTFTPTAAQGAFNKDIYVVTRDSKGTIIKSTLALTYSYNTKTGAKTTSPALGTPISVTLGSYESVSLMMRVWWQNWGTRTGAYTDYFSDASAPNIRTSGKCETGQTNNWEDGGDSNYADFVYTMTCKTTKLTGAAWLTK